MFPYLILTSVRKARFCSVISTSQSCSAYHLLSAHHQTGDSQNNSRQRFIEITRETSQSTFGGCILDLLCDRLVFLVEEFDEVEEGELDFFSDCDFEKEVDDGFIY
jgi:hypothetical protein